MRRLLFGALAVAGATATLAAPSSAQADTTAIPGPCHSTEAYVECAERHANTAVDAVIYYVFYWDPGLPPTVRKVQELCERSMDPCPL
jgi:hypothetical protein